MGLCGGRSARRRDRPLARARLAARSDARRSDDAGDGRVDVDQAPARGADGAGCAGGDLLRRPRHAGKGPQAPGAGLPAQAVRAAGAAGRSRAAAAPETGGVMAKARKVRRLRRPALAVLSRKKSLYSTRRLLEAAKSRGFSTRVIDVMRCNLVLEPGNPRVFHKGKEVRGLSVALPRIGASVTQIGLQAVRQLEAMGVPMVNGAAAIARSRDKLNALQVLAAGGGRIPRTGVARGGGGGEELVAQVGGLPAILKLLQGTQGVGVMIAHSLAEVESILSTLWDLGQEILLQEFVAEARGRDLRALVVGDRVAGAMRREARKGEFRSNLHRGGFGVAAQLERPYEEAAVRAAQVLGLSVAGVDLLESDAGPKVMELNSSPGFEGLERATGLDIAGEIIAEAGRLAEGARRAMAL